MSYHIACYNTKFSPTPPATGNTAKYAGTCESCGKQIMPGDRFTWKRTSVASAVTPPTIINTADASTVFLNMLLPAMEKSLADRFDANKLADEVTTMVYDKLKDSNAAVTIDIRLPTGEIKKAGTQHKQFPTLVKALAAKVPVWLAGPSGSGKTTAAMAAAKVLGLEFRYTGAVGDAYALTGYNDAQGRYVRTPFRDAWENGGLFLWDEVDASDPNALLAFNAALANGTAAFPDAIVPKHKGTVLIAAANTFGHGANHEYVGRMKMDMAFLKRFAFMSWDYDEHMEIAVSPNPNWTKRVQQVRRRVKEKGLRIMITPRESILGAQLLAAGISQDDVERMTLMSGCTEDQWKQIA